MLEKSPGDLATVIIKNPMMLGSHHRGQVITMAHHHTDRAPGKYPRGSLRRAI